MLLFLTRDAFCRRSTDGRRVGDGDPERPPRAKFSVSVPFFCQKSLGEAALSAGDDWKGDESVLRASF